jgi:hypothetical protein
VIRCATAIVPGLPFVPCNLAKHFRHFAQLVARRARLQPSRLDKNVFGLQQQVVGFSRDLNVRHGVPHAIIVDRQAGAAARRGCRRAAGSWTQASRANQAWSAWQTGQRVREKNTGLARKRSRSI